MPREQKFRIAAVQAAPVFLDRSASIEKACELIRKAGSEGANLAVFPETFIPTYPLWVWFIPPGHSKPLRELYAELVANSVTVPGPETERLCSAARAAGTSVAIGVNEVNADASRSSLYNTLVYIGSDGRLVGRHRKLVPTAGERLVWAQGDGSDIDVYEQPFGRLGGLICWENYMPPARQTLYASGIEVYAAPTWDCGEPWLSTLRHIAKEGRVYVVGCCSAVRASDIPDRFGFKQRYLDGAREWINPGDSAIVDPDGKLMAGPAHEQETILYADADLAAVTGSRWQLDVAGHYSRPDVFEVVYHRHRAEAATNQAEALAKPRGAETRRSRRRR